MTSNFGPVSAVKFLAENSEQFGQVLKSAEIMSF